MRSTGEQAKEVIRRWNDEGWSAGNYDLAQEVIAPEMIVHGAGGQPVKMGPAGLVELIKAWRTAFPDGQMTIDDLIVEGDLVGIRNTWRGTHQGEFYGIPPTGRRVEVTSIGLDRVVDGKVVEGWGELDMLGMMQSLGAMPAAGPGAAAGGRPTGWGDSAGATPAAPADPEGNRERALAYLEALNWNDRGELEQLVDTASYVEHNPIWGAHDFATSLASLESVRAAMPDLHHTPDADHIVAEGDRVVVHSQVAGTHSGAELFGVAPTGRRVTWTQSEMLRVAGGRIAERWLSADSLSLFQQLAPAPAAPAATPGGATRREIRFASQGVECAGWLYLPAGLEPGKQVPCIVMANAITAVKEVTLPLWADRFAAAGFAALAFDYRGWGTSEGEPRNHFVAYEQLQDLRNAITWAARQPEIDPERIGGWGISMGGSHMLYLASFDRRLKAGVATAASYTGAAMFKRTMGADAMRGLLAQAAVDRIQRMDTGAPVTYKQAWGRPGDDCALPQEEAFNFYAEAQRTVAPGFENRITLQSVENMMEYSPDFAIDIASPTAVMFIHGGREFLPPELAQEAYERAGEPKRILLLDCEHSDLYDKQPWMGQAADAAIGWFRENFPIRAAGTPEEEANKRLVVRLYEETNAGNLDIIDELCADDLLNHGSVIFPDMRGKGEFKSVLKQLLVAFPDLRFLPEDWIAEGDLVAGRATVTATHLGDFMGMAPATGRRVAWTGMAVYRVAGGKLVERWANQNDLSLMQQLGVGQPEAG